LRRWFQVVAVIVSVATLLVTGYGWSVYRHLNTELTTSDVLGPARPPDGATDILLVGMDSRTDAHGNPLPQQVLDELTAGPDTGDLNTDTLILVRIPNDPTLRSTAVSIPRDSYVAIPGFGTHKINSAYARAMLAARTQLQAKGVTGAELERQSRQAGRRTLIATVEALTGSSVDHYAEVNLAGFAEITSTLGGVPICLKAPTRDSYSGANFPAGPQTVSGASALEFVRQRHGLPRGDLDRVVRQQAFLAGLAHKVLSAGTLANPATLSQLITVIGRYVVVDQGWNLLGFAAQAQGLSGGNITFRTIPTGRPDLPTPSDGVAVQVDPTLVRSFFTNLATPPPAPGRAGPDSAAAAPVIVDVANATHRSGLAADASDALDNDGFAPGAIGNAPRPTAHSAVRASATTRDGAQRVAHLLGNLPVHVDDTVAAGRVEVVLGADYSGPTATGTNPGSTPPPAPPSAATTAGDHAPGSPVITADGTPCVN
jgi:LCP family protein required for cell wall assembly